MRCAAHRRKCCLYCYPARDQVGPGYSSPFVRRGERQWPELRWQRRRSHQPLPSLFPSESAKVISPSDMVLTGLIVRATPSLPERSHLVRLDTIQLRVGGHHRERRVGSANRLRRHPVTHHGCRVDEFTAVRGLPCSGDDVTVCGIDHIPEGIHSHQCRDHNPRSQREPRRCQFHSSSPV